MPSRPLSDSESRYDNNDPHEGDRRFFDDVELVAIDHSDCSNCFFGKSKTTSYACSDVRCHCVVWVTPLQYITHRLTK